MVFVDFDVLDGWFWFVFILIWICGRCFRMCFGCLGDSFA